MAEVESAEEFGERVVGLMREKIGYSNREAELVLQTKARDTAIREAAKREALVELKRLVETSKWLDLAHRKESGWGRAYQAAMKQLEAKYAAALGVKL